MENKISRKKILLTGASGTVGFETLQHLVQHTDYEITVFDLKTQNSVKKTSSLSISCRDCVWRHQK